MIGGAGQRPGLVRPRNPWFPFGTGEDAGVRLLCLPHAGAGASAYRSWDAGLPASIAVCPLQPPGRETRRAERPMTSAVELARRLAPEIIALVRPPYALFGHSTGALCAFEVVREVRRLGGTLPVHLFVSGRRAPHLPIGRTDIAGLSTGELAAMLRRMGGTPEVILTDPSMLELIQPLLAADFQVDEVYDYHAEPLLPVPVTAFAATRDHVADLGQVGAWRQETSLPYDRVVLDGDHFAIFESSATVLGRIAATLGP